MSPFKNLFELNAAPPKVRLTYAASTQNRPFSNVGDALSAVIVSALSGLPCSLTPFSSQSTRLASVGTIGHEFKEGKVHFWGTGVDRTRNPVDATLKHYTRPPNTEFKVHALRGPFTRQTFEEAGIICPPIYGDPVWFLPSIFKDETEKKYELGVVTHITELQDYTDHSEIKAEYKRYHVPVALQPDIKIINTLSKPDITSIGLKISEILSCKRIVSTSLHGLVIAETYGIPCLYFGHSPHGLQTGSIAEFNPIIDHRMQDFYSGIGRKVLRYYGQRRIEDSCWEDVIEGVDQAWEPVDWDPSQFLEAFPLPLTFNPLSKDDTLQREVLSQNKY